MSRNNNTVIISELGEKLRAARERKELTIDDVQKKTHINANILNAIESGKADGILNSTYIKSFLKQYSEFLELDAHQVINDYFNSRREDRHKPAESVATEKDARNHEAVNFMPLVKVVVAGLLLVVLSVFIAINVIKYFNRPKPLNNTVMKNKIQKAIPVKSDKKKSEALKSVPVIIPKDIKLKLLLKINQTVFVKIKADGVLLFERVLDKGAVEMLTADKSINIYTAKGEAIDLVLNGKSLGSPGRGILKNVEITRSGLKVR